MRHTRQQGRLSAAPHRAGLRAPSGWPGAGRLPGAGAAIRPAMSNVRRPGLRRPGLRPGGCRPAPASYGPAAHPQAPYGPPKGGYGAPAGDYDMAARRKAGLKRSCCSRPGSRGRPTPTRAALSSPLRRAAAVTYGQPGPWLHPMPADQARLRRAGPGLRLRTAGAGGGYGGCCGSCPPRATIRRCRWRSRCTRRRQRLHLPVCRRAPTSSVAPGRPVPPPTPNTRHGDPGGMPGLRCCPT